MKFNNRLKKLEDKICLDSGLSFKVILEAIHGERELTELQNKELTASINELEKG
jgi:hypothetical protein